MGNKGNAALLMAVGGPGDAQGSCDYVSPDSVKYSRARVSQGMMNWSVERKEIW